LRLSRPLTFPPLPVVQDFAPWNGWYNETVVEQNEIFGGFAAEHGDDEHGPSSSGAIIKCAPSSRSILLQTNVCIRA
jgi:hypothetical protein